MPAKDIFKGTSPVNLVGPMYHARTVTPDDGTELEQVTRAVWVGGAGDLSVEMWDGTTVVFSSVSAGTMLPVRVRKINATNTTATNVLSLW